MSARLPKEGRGGDVLRCDVRGAGIKKERKTTNEKQQKTFPSTCLNVEKVKQRLLRVGGTNLAYNSNLARVATP